MQIIIDTREQKRLEFIGHETTIETLKDGDYNIKELIHSIVIERKSLQDFYGSIIKGHARFKNEIVRSRLQGKTFYLFLEGTLEDFYSMKWSKRKLKITPKILRQIVETMVERHQIVIIECLSRTQMSELIVKTIDINKKKKNGDETNGKRNRNGNSTSERN